MYAVENYQINKFNSYFPFTCEIVEKFDGFFLSFYFSFLFLFYSGNVFFLLIECFFVGKIAHGNEWHEMKRLRYTISR